MRKFVEDLADFMTSETKRKFSYESSHIVTGIAQGSVFEKYHR
jgi:hypothetical protein